MNKQFNRRTFLAAALVGSAMSSSVSLPAFGADKERLRLGVIGTGMRGQILLAE